MASLPRQLIFIVEHLTSGGTEKVALELASLFEDEIPVTLLTFDSHQDSSFFKIPDRTKVIRMGDGFFTTKLQGSKRNEVGGVLPLWRLVPIWIERLRALRRHFRGLDAPHETIVIGFGTQMSCLGLHALKSLRIPFIATEHFAPKTGSLMKRILRRWFYSHASAITVLTDKSKLQVPKIWRDRVHVIPNPVPLPAATRDIPGPSSKLMIAVGRLVPQKGFDLLIDALSRIKGSISPWKLRIYGEGPDREALETQIREKGLSGTVEIHSPTRALHDRYLESEIFVLSSRFEGFSLVLAEAMSRGLACVAFDCDLGPGELIENGKTGLLVEAENSDSMAQALQDLMSDNELRDKLGSAALATSKRFEPNAIKELWFKLFSDVLTKSHT